MSRTAESRGARRRGMTLVELIVAMAIFTTIMGGVILMFTTVTNTVRRSYRTMDLYDKARGSLLAVERDIQTAFAAPASGADFQFCGEPNGFVFIGVADNGKLGRLTYVVHRDTSRLTDPASDAWRGERVRLARNAEDWDRLKARFDGLDAYYPRPSGVVEVEVEVVYGLLLRYYEDEVEQVGRFDKLEDFLKPEPIHMPPPVLFNHQLNFFYETLRPNADYFPWFSRHGLWENLQSASAPWHLREKLETVEQCHYWLQLLGGPGRPTWHPWNPLEVWWQGEWRPNDRVAIDAINAGKVVMFPPNWQPYDQFWFDHFAPLAPEEFVNAPNTSKRRHLWDHVVADDIVLAAVLLDPTTGDRINARVPADADLPPLYVPVLESTPFFQYAAESNVLSNSFNALFNLNFDAAEGQPGAVEQAVLTLKLSPNNPNVDPAIAKMIEARQFYDVGSPMQSRLPSSFEITFWVLSDPMVQGASVDLQRFSQRIHIPSGFLRRSRAVE